jgi:hypothetical protein
MRLIGKVLRFIMISRAIVTGNYTRDMEALQTALAVHGSYLFINIGAFQGAPIFMMFADDCGHHDA